MDNYISEEALRRVMWNQNNTNNDVTRYIADAVAEKLCRDNPKPLTMDELMEMNGEPVWVQRLTETDSYDRRPTGWYLIYIEQYSLYAENTDASLFSNDSYGQDWFAYRTKPEWGAE